MAGLQSEITSFGEGLVWFVCKHARNAEPRHQVYLILTEKVAFVSVNHGSSLSAP
jgi:hypothetical protein